MEYRKDIVHRPDSEYFWVELGPIPGYPEWHVQSEVTRYPFPTLAAANLFASNHRRLWPGREIEVTDGQRVEH
jgi:hypothetical protein